MKFDFTKFVNELHEDFQDSLSIDEITQLLELGESYSKDSPLSTGKNFVINHIAFKGEKYSGEIIDYSQNISTGINIWIASNLKGKSSILKIIKYALTGNNSLKPDIKKALNEILLDFSIGNKDYTIYLRTSSILKAQFFNTKISTWTELEDIKKDPLFEARGESEYSRKMQGFFFNQFSYYSLKWTQKNPKKDNSDLIEAAASWKTYFKSIFLESKDSYDLMYGGQGKKIFLMLLGLELTYPINRLKVKMDFLNSEKGKDVLIEKANAKNKVQDKNSLLEKLKEVQIQIEKFTKKIVTKSNINDLNKEYNLLQYEYKTEWNKLKVFNKEIQNLKEKRNELENKQKAKDKELFKAKKRLENNKKKILDLKEYLEIGVFFSNLDIKHCPSCHHSIDENKKKEKLASHKCALCDESISEVENVSTVEDYTEKISKLNLSNQQLSILLQTLEKEKVFIIEESKSTYSKIIKIEHQTEELKDLNILSNQLKIIEQRIKTELEKSPIDFSEKDELISQKAVIEFQIKELKELSVKSNSFNYDSRINLLHVAIKKLNKFRFEMSKNTLERLQEIMLIEIQEFGLKSITEIQISKNYGILYRQGGDLITFKDITEGEQLRAKIAFYLSLIQLDIEFNFGKHTRFLMIDSPGKEEGDPKYLLGLSKVLKNIQTRFGSQLQILIGTAERDLSGIVENQYVTPEDTFIF